MPTILRSGAYRFFFYAGDGEEPRHVHVERDEKVAKFWLEPIGLQTNKGFNQAEIRAVCKIIKENQSLRN